MNANRFHLLNVIFLITCAHNVHALANSRATAETKNLFDNLRATASRRQTLVGMDQSTTMGEFMRQSSCGYADSSRINGYTSDLRQVCGKGPGIYGFELARVLADFYVPLSPSELRRRRDQEQNQVRYHVKQIHQRGGVITFHWHSNHPVDSNHLKYNQGPLEIWQMLPPSICTANPTLRSLRNCGSSYNKFKNRFDLVVKWMNSLKDDSGKPIPVIFRPFHEQNGNWFWWGVPNARLLNAWQVSYRSMWKWMVNYHNIHGNNNILWATSPNGGRGLNTKANYLKYVPELQYVDVLGYDYYGDYSSPNIQKQVDLVVQIAEQHGKIPAVTEIGYNTDGNRAKWPANVWSKATVGAILNKRIAWALMWFNYPENGNCNFKYYGPHKNHRNERDFQKVCNSRNVLFEGQYSFYRPSSNRGRPSAGNGRSTPSGGGGTAQKCQQLKICNVNNGRGVGNLYKCARQSNRMCAKDGNNCNCKVKLGVKSRKNGIKYCMSNNGCGFGARWKCQHGETCARTDKTFRTKCVSLCSSPSTGKKCPSTPGRCTTNNGRGSGRIQRCQANWCAVDGNQCKCRVAEGARAGNGIQYCLSNGGCGFGSKWNCGGQVCTKTDKTYQTPCVSKCA